MKTLTIILDRAHGEDVPGKRSPDGSHIEYQWSNDICRKLKGALENKGYTVSLTCLDDKEPGLTKRKRMCEDIAVVHDNTLMLSLHNNAAGMGKTWMDARGFSVYTTIGNTKSDLAATQIFKDLKNTFPALKARTDMRDGDPDNEANFTVLTGRRYKAVLIEWLFQDNKADVALLKDEITNNMFISSLIHSIEVLNETL